MKRWTPFADTTTIIAVVMPAALAAQINALSNERGVNRSFLIRTAIQATYFAPKRADTAAHTLPSDTSNGEPAGGMQRPGEEEGEGAANGGE